MAGGGAVVQENDALWRVVNARFSSNTFIQATGAAGDCLVIDPGLDGPAVESALSALALRPRLICCTHGHFDHVGSAATLQRKYGARVLLHAADQRTLASSNFLLMALKLPERIEIPETELVSDDSPAIPVAGTALRFHATPGHTPGSCIVQFQDTLFTGDTLFAHGMDSLKFPGSNATQLRQSLRRIWNLFPADARVCPGHGSSAAFGWVKGHNMKLREFVGVSAGSDELAPA